MNNNPIGIFDSGIGGLTVANAIHKLMPNEPLIYFGDTAHFPYGEKSPDSIKYYSIRIADFLIEKNAKCIVIACNTASSIAYEVVKKHVKNKIPVISVIEPVVNVVCNNKSLNKIGVIATKGTIKADAYAKKIKAIAPEKEVSSLATPLLAPMIEEGFFNNNISKTIINSYLSKPKLKKIDALILACTHYPLIHKEISNYYNDSIEILDSADIAAQAVLKALTSAKLLASKNKMVNHFYVSDYTKSFETSTKIFFKGKLQLEKFGLWDND